MSMETATNVAALLGPKCDEMIWVRNVGKFGGSVNNGIGKCITATLVDQEGGGAVGELTQPMHPLHDSGCLL